MNVPHLIRKEKKSYAASWIYSKNKSSICEIVKNEEEICVSFAVVPQIAKLTVSDKCLVNMERY